MTDPLEAAKVYYTSAEWGIATAMAWAWQGTVNHGLCLEYLKTATDEEKDALIVARRLGEKDAAVTISDQILERHRDES